MTKSSCACHVLPTTSCATSAVDCCLTLDCFCKNLHTLSRCLLIRHAPAYAVTRVMQMCQAHGKLKGACLQCRAGGS